jgi:uroporphyrinogen-III synthase
MPKSDQNQIVEDNSLKGKCILITRPLHQSARLAEALRSRGAMVEELPLISICPPDSFEPFDRAFAQLDLYAWIVFASANAVETTMERAQHLQSLDQHSLIFEQIKNKSIACIGPATAAALLCYGIKATLTPAIAVAESMLEEFPRPVRGPATPDRSSTMPSRVLWPRTNIGRNIIKETLEKSGWQVDIVHSYKTAGPLNPQATAEKLLSLLEGGKISAITLTSSETVRKLWEILSLATGGDRSLQTSLLANVGLAVIGPETAGTCWSIFGRVDIQAAEFTTNGLVEALSDHRLSDPL